MQNGTLLVDTSMKVVDALHSVFQDSACYTSSSDSRQVTIDMDDIRDLEQTEMLVSALNADESEPVSLSVDELNGYQSLTVIC